MPRTELPIAVKRYLQEQINARTIKELSDGAHEPMALTPIPWAGRTCADCPFYKPLNVSGGNCQVHWATVTAQTESCAYSDPGNHDAAQIVIDMRKTLDDAGAWQAWFDACRIPVD